MRRAGGGREGGTNVNTLYLVESLYKACVSLESSLHHNLILVVNLKESVDIQLRILHTNKHTMYIHTKECTIGTA